MSYRIAKPDEYLAITGMGIKNVHITKSAFVWPFQRCMRFSVQPHDFSLNLQAMTKEKLQFLLPVVFTIGPDVNARGANGSYGTTEPTATGGGDAAHDGSDDGTLRRREDRGDALMKYAMLLAESSEGGKTTKQYLEGIVKGIIEGETRVLVSSMTMEEIFTERELFKKRIFHNIQGELESFGLRVWNSNIKELKDAPNSIYFESLSRKAHEGATQQARIDVADAQLRGTVGESERKGLMEREISKINAETAVQKTQRDIERAAADALLNTRKAELQRDVDIAKVMATRTLESKDQDLKKEVEVKRAAAEVERLRATEVVKATISREAKQQAADAAAYEIEKDARANNVKAQQETDAQAYNVKIDAVAKAEAEYNLITRRAEAHAFETRAKAEAINFAAQKEADAALVKTLKEAEGMSAMADAYGKMAHAFGGPQGLLQYMMIENGTYAELAKHNADAVRGMAPKISVWNTGSSSSAEGQSQSATDAMRNVYQMLPPLMTTINEQTGITLPEWQFGRMAAGVDAVGGEQPRVNGKQ